MNSAFNLSAMKSPFFNMTMNWTNDGKNQAEGMSEDEYDDFHPRN